MAYLTKKPTNVDPRTAASSATLKTNQVNKYGGVGNTAYGPQFGAVAGASTTNQPSYVQSLVNQFKTGMNLLNQAQPYLNPQTGGQSAGQGAQSVNFNVPQQTNSQEDIDLLKQQYANSAGGINDQLSGLDSSYNTSKTDIENAVADSQKAADRQKGDLTNSYADIYGRQLRTYKDMKRNQQNTFSALGTLDSSAYQNAVSETDNQFRTDLQKTDLEKQRSIQAVDDQFTSYKKQADSQLAQLGQQYLAGKNALTRLMGQNRLEEAGAIRDYLSQVKSQADQIQNSINDFANQVALMKAQGVNVVANITGQNANTYSDQVNKQIANLVASQRSLPTAQTTEGGYMRKKNLYQSALGL